MTSIRDRAAGSRVMTPVMSSPRFLKNIVRTMYGRCPFSVEASHPATRAGGTVAWIGRPLRHIFYPTNLVKYVPVNHAPGRTVPCPRLNGGEDRASSAAMRKSEVHA